MAAEPRPLDVLYVGPDSGTCRARFDAVLRLGHRAVLLDPFEALPDVGIARSWSFKTGGLGFAGLVERYLAAEIGSRRFDLAYVDSGELIGPSTVQMLRQHADRVANYNPDNPYVARDGHRWRLFLRAVPAYDMLFVPRLSNVGEARSIGARAVERIWFAADDPLKDAAHLPTTDARLPYRSPVSFVGTWMPERGPLLKALVEGGLPVRIFGPRWDRAPEFSALAAHIVNGALAPAEFAAAVAAADISIALLSKGNRDEHTTRSMEIPVLGSLLCGERTLEHLALYKDGDEAVFWSSAEECVAACRALIADPARRAAIASAGRARAITNGHFNEPLMRRMIELAMSGARQASSSATIGAA